MQLNGQRAGQQVRGHGALLLSVTMVILVFTSLRLVPPAQVAVVVTLGHVSQNVLHAGMHVCNPLSSLHQFSTKTTLFEMRNHVPTKEGLIIDLDVALLFHIDADRARDVYLNLGHDYVSIVVEPELASAVRGLTSEVDAKALYTSGRMVIQRKLKEELVEVLQPRGILIEDVLLKAIVLPQQLTQSIELKAQAEQEAARMEFVLAKEKQEAERKAIEAKGVAEFQRIVSHGLSKQLLQWKGIEATEKLAESKNSKIVVMGNSKNSLPVILGNGNE